MSKTFTCAMCHGDFPDDEPDEVAEVEYVANFGIDFRPEETDVVCDDCYAKIHPSKHSERAKEAVKATLRDRVWPRGDEECRTN